MDNTIIHRIIPILRRLIKKWQPPWVEEVASKTGDPFKVLISCLLSLRTQDRTTGMANKRLFSIASSTEEMKDIPLEAIEKAIYPVGFYRIKAKRIKELSRELVEKYSSKVPDAMDGLLKLKGVGRKTANLVLTLGYGKYGICVDTHVHRITNRWGYVKTKRPEETEFALREKLPKKYWKEINGLLVVFGQNVCKPLSPLCSTCPIRVYCKRVGVKRYR
ncbi:MAG: endonuclease III [Nitrospirae bacterium]|nr:endonuclease III [Nitrospirota bacterium]